MCLYSCGEISSVEGSEVGVWHVVFATSIHNSIIVLANSFVAYINEIVVSLCLGEVEKPCSKVEEIVTHDPSWEYKPGVVVDVSPEKKDQLVHTLKVV